MNRKIIEETEINKNKIEDMILKQGSRGKEVKDIQEFLGLSADGVFGPKTHNKVCEWQKENDLVVDGIVGPATWNAMGLASTDNSELTEELDNGLVIHKHYLPDHEYMTGSKPEYVFLHHTAGWHNPYKTVDHWNNTCVHFIYFPKNGVLCE